MLKKTMVIGSMTLLVLNVLIVMEIVPVMVARANDPVWNVDHWETTGDWIIDGTTTNYTYNSTTIVVNGNLTVMASFTLTLQNVELVMNGTTDGQYFITVKPQGSLIIEDLDNDRNTTGDVSIVRGGSRYGFMVEGPDGYLELRNSELHQCGWNNAEPDWRDAGLNIQAANAIVSGNDISGNFRGVIILGADATGVKVSNNSIYNNQATGVWVYSDGGNNLIADNDIYGNNFGVILNTSVNPNANQVINNKVHDQLVEGIIIQYSSNALLEGNQIYGNSIIGIDINSSSNINIKDNTVYENQDAVVIELSSNFYIAGNSIYENTFTGLLIQNCTDFVVENNSIQNHTGTNFYAGTGIFIRGSQTVLVYDNFLYGNGGQSILTPDWDCQIYSESSTGVQLVKNHIMNSTKYGILAVYQPDIVAEDNLLENNLAPYETMMFVEITGSGLVNNNTVLDSGLYAIYADGCNDFTISNNTVDNIDYSGGAGIVAQNYYSNSKLKVYIYNNVVKNIGIGNEGIGIFLSSGSDHVVDGNTLNTITSYGIVIDTRDSLIKNNKVSNVGTTASASTPYDVSGISLSGQRNTLVNNTIENCQSPFGTNPVAGLQFGYKDIGSYARDSVIMDSYISGNEINVRADEINGVVSNVTIINSTLVKDGDTQSDFYLTQNSHLTTLNTTFDNTSVAFGDSLSSLAVKWFLDVHVVDSGVGKDGAVVLAQSLLGATEPPQMNYTTQTISGDPGWARFIPLTEFVNEGGTRVDHSPHWINVTYGTMEGLARPKVWKSHVIEIELNERPVVDDLILTSTSVFRNQTVEFRIESHDFENIESDLQAHFEYRDSNDYAWNNTFFASPSWNGAGGYWNVSFTPKVWAPTGMYDIRARVNDTYGSYGYWFYKNDSVNVMNNPPYVEKMYNQTTSPLAPNGSIYRGDFSWIFGDGQDVENLDDQNLTAVEIQWNAGSGWQSTLYWTLGPEPAGGDWRRKFEPPASLDTKTGVYQFQVRFQDKDGAWSQFKNLDNLTVLNNPPELVNFTKGSGFVYRGGSVKVYVNASDREETEAELQVHFYYRLSTSSGPWEDGWFGANGAYLGANGMFVADFSPPDTADPGVYEFMVEITDHETQGVLGSPWQFTPAGTLIDVRNNLPSVDGIKVSSDFVGKGVGALVYIHVNATDSDGEEMDLVIDSIQWRENNSISGDPPSPPTWMTTGLTKFSINTFIDYDSVGMFLRGSMEPKSDATEISHDIRVRVRDQNTGISDWFYLMNAFTVTNVLPVIEDITLQQSEVFRGDTVYITLNATNPGGLEKDLTVYIEYKKPTSTTWSQLAVTPDFYDTAGYWKIPFSPEQTLEDDSLGAYKFQGQVKNSFGATSDHAETTGTLTIKNNLPKATLLSVDDNTVVRTETITIYANGDDREKQEKDLEAIFEWSIDGSTWEDTDYFDGAAKYSTTNTRWEIKFKPQPGAVLGSYHFRVKFFDGKENGQELTKENLVTVSNAQPEVTSLTLSATSEYRNHAVTLSALVSDLDHDADTLIPDFQFKGPNGDWVSQDSSTYFQNARFNSGTNRWDITFTAPSSAEVGDYFFRVEFTDDDGATSPPYEASSTLDLKNSPPEVEITKPTPGSHKPGTLKFEATAYDEEGSDLTWEWDFGDGKTSSDESPSHSYSKAGDYEVTLTITDADDESVEYKMTITITEPPGGLDMVLLLMILLPLIIVVLILVFLLTKKKKSQELPPEGPQAGEATGFSAATTAPSPPQPQQAPFAAPPAQEGGQTIKCPKCGTGFTVTDPTRPITIECPNCHAKGTLTQ